ncbi:signal recognition particle subunit SRP19/SEC65 family protein [Methanothermobacter wolfeii]|nr:signal recognition particle subunit SRP19/SEC65 family protein [Methanothermobacter wolfeii]MDI6702484.1 signal recognition particle subunit SRP19/SEC65 family protein [Methanothermobacter wolfeii]MDI6841881.1 signal recognition particle subunit SRP19/SEC65 family protein [Methanothermobacter wolfeii]SCM56560.1 Signal recognition particle 19 kDa protein {ECO:0000255/HAMAP-Rule:MF_00305} [Methanothermobacter wolfeii]
MIIWPAYIDSRKSRSEGRRIPLEDSVEAPSSGEILRALRKLQLDARMESDKSYPASWWESSGRVIVEYDGRKKDILLKVARLIKSQKKKNK